MGVEDIKVEDIERTPEWKLEHTLFINRSDSRCGKCYGNADPNEKGHYMSRHNARKEELRREGKYDESVIGKDWPHCDTEFIYMSSDYAGYGNMKANCLAMRPDLEWVGPPELDLDGLDHTEL